MTKCKCCGKEPLETDSCIKVPILHNGKKYDPVPYGISAEDIDSGDKCPDCGVAVYGYHHPGCDREICPVCGGRVLSCDCNDNISPSRYKEMQELAKSAEEFKKNDRSIKFTNVEKKNNKFICQMRYNEIDDLTYEGMLAINFNMVTNIKEYRSIDKNTIKFYKYDESKIKEFKDEILNGLEKDLHLILNIENSNQNSYKYNKEDKILNINLNRDNGNETYLNLIKGYEEIIAIVRAYKIDNSIADRKVNVEIYDLPMEKMKEIVD